MIILPEYMYIILLIILGASFFILLFRKERDKKANTKTRETLSMMQDMHQKLAENNARIMALEDNFESLYDVELETGRYEVIINGDIYSIINAGLLNTQDYFADLQKNIERVVFAEDREGLCSVLSRGSIRRKLAKNPSFDYYYRIITKTSPVWFKIRVVYKDEKRKNIIIGVFNAQTEMTEKLREKTRRNELINQMLDDDGLFIIDCVKDTRKTVHDNCYGAVRYKDTDSYSKSVSRYMENCVAAADRAMMREMTDPTYMLGRTSIEKEFTVQYRDITTGLQRFYEMRIVRFSETEILQSFKENDRVIVERLLFDRIKEGYFALFCVDLDSGLLEVVKNDYNLLEKAGVVTPHQAFMERVAESFEDETKDLLLNLGHVEYVREKFKKEDKAAYIYRSHIDEGIKWGKLDQFVLTRHEDGSPSLFAFGFSLLDENANEKEELKHKVTEALNMVGGLASRYETLYYININERVFKVFSLNGEKLPETKRLVSEGGDPFRMMKKYGASELIHPDDRALFENITVKSVKEMLAHSKRFTIRFRRNFRGSYHWVEMDATKYEDIDEVPNAIAIGFADLDNEIRTEQALKQCFNILSKNSPSQDSIDELLSTAGEFYGADRCCIFEYSGGKDTISNTYEWCKKDIESVRQRLQNLPSKNVDKWVKAPSNLVVPVMNGDELMGYITVDHPTQFTDNTEVLNNVAVVAYSEILKSRQAQMARYELAKVFSDTFLDSYVSAYYINLVDYSQIVFHRNAFIQETYGNIENYLTSINKYIDECVYPDDRATMHEVVEPEYIKKRLRDESCFSVYMRDISSERMSWYRFDITRGSDEDHAGFAFTDVTEKMAEENERARQLEEARKTAESANESKTNFLFNMSHDIRTPMNAISGFTNIAIKHIDNKEKVLDCLSKIQQSGSMLLSLINSVLEVSRIESGNATLAEQPYDVFFSFENLESTMQELAESKDIKLTFEFGKITDRYVFCDYSRCMRIYTNIISNAIKYTKEGGFVKVKVEQLGKAEGGTGRYCFTVTDNGIGMSEEFQKHVFEQFSREKTATVSGIQGTGLGMSVVKSFVDLMGGTIECKSRQGKGTTFTTILPFKINPEAVYLDPVTGVLVSSSNPVEKAEKVDFTGKRILLVEDSEMNQEIALEILSAEGLVADCADDGTEAVDILKKKGPFYYDFILMDIQMPLMNGYDTTKAIRKMYPDAHIPIIALSANAFAEDKAASIASGMDDHIAKPIIVKELFGTLARFMK